MGGSSFSAIRSYQRIFRPSRRIYQIDGRRLPLPDGIALSWVGWAAGTLLLILVLSSRSLLFSGMVGAVAGCLGGGARGWRGATLAAVGVFAAVQFCGVVLGWLDWPLRLIVLPGFVASGAGQLTPDGRSAWRYLWCRVMVRLRPARRSLGRTVFVDGDEVLWAPRVWIAPDHRGAVLEHGRVHGPARLVFSQRVVLCRARGRVIARPVVGRRVREGEVTAQIVELGAGQVLEVRR